MNDEHSKDKFNLAHERENKEAEKLAQELETPTGAQQLGDEAYETAKKEQKKQGLKP